MVSDYQGYTAVGTLVGDMGVTAAEWEEATGLPLTDAPVQVYILSVEE
jgi:hypothetical protein